MKQRATLDEQINTLVSHGVTFDLMDEEKARRFLSNNSYFFKIKSYENNYRKTIDESGGYVYDNLDFGHLVELSLVDFALSRLVWSMCSSIEHSIKVRFNQLIMKDQNPDIADICVRRCFSGNLPTMHDNPYTDDMKTGLQGDFALWNLWELLGFNDQLTLFNTYWRYRHNENHPYQHLLFIVRKMRNAVSHGNCLLTDMSRPSPHKKDTGRSDIEITKAAMRLCDKPRKTGSKTRSFQQSLDRLVAHNYACVLLCHLEFVDSPRALIHSCHEVQSFLDRMNQRRALYFGVAGGAREPRNILIDSTLSAIETLSRSYIKKARIKADELDAKDPYGSRKQVSVEKIRERVDRRKLKITDLQTEIDNLEQQARRLAANEAEGEQS